MAGVITDPANIIIDAGVTLNMTGDTSFNAGSSFIMDPTATILGAGNNLSISALNASTLGNITGVNLLTLSLISGSSPIVFTSNSSSAFSVTTVKTNNLSSLSRNVTDGSGNQEIFSDSNQPGGLQYMLNNLSGSYILENNINASETSNWNGGTGFTPIGTMQNGGSLIFSGTFNGNGMTISNLTINNTTSGLYTNQGFSQNDVGLFGYTASNSLIENIGLLNVSITANSTINPNRSAGALVGDNQGSIINSYATGIVIGNPASGSASNYANASDLAGYTGGLVGVNDGSISNSSANVTVTAGGYTGGLVGENGYQSNGFISNSFALGTVTGGSVDYKYNPNPVSDPNCNLNDCNSYHSITGGLVGEDQNSTSYITDSYAKGNVTGGGNVGGLVGDFNGINITYSYATGSVTNITSSADQGQNNSGSSGGLVGSFNNGTISYSYATGNVNGGYSGSGGLAGNNSGTIEYSYATGNVSGEGTYNVIGGLVGANGGNNSGTNLIENSYATGNVTETNILSSDVSGAGGLVGLNDGAYIYDSYSIGNVTGGTLSSTTAAGGLVGITAFSNPSIIMNSYSTGLVTGNNSGGLIGANNFGGAGSTLTNDAWYTASAANAIGNNNHGAAVHTLASLGDGTDVSTVSNFYVSTATVYDQSNSTGHEWDFTNTTGTWKIPTPYYPVLRSSVVTLIVLTPSTITAGTPFSITVEAVNNAYNDIAQSYAGTVQFSSTDAYPAVLPSNYTFTGKGTGLDNGTHTFTNGVTLFTAGNQTITAADTHTASPVNTASPITTGTSSGITVSPGSSYKEVVTGTTGNLTITPYDQYNNLSGTSITGAVNIPASSGVYNSLIIDLTNGNTASLGGSITLNGKLKIYSGSTFNPGTFTITGSILDNFGTLLVNGATLASNYSFSGTRTSESGSTVNYDGTTQTIDNTLTYYNLLFSGSGTKTFNGNINTTNVTVGVGTTINPGSFVINGDINIGLATINGTLLVEAANFNANYGNFASGIFGSSSLVNYAANINQTIDTKVPYYNLITSGSGTKTLDGNITLPGNLTIGNSTTLALGGYTATVNGNFVNNGSVAFAVTGITAQNKNYDGTANATINTASAALNGTLVIDGNTVTLNTTGAIGTFTSSTAGNGIDVTVTGLTASGTGFNGSYTITPQPTVTANITTLPILTVSGITANNKTYDGTSSATLNFGSAVLELNGVPLTDPNLTLVSSGAIGTFSDKNVSTGKTVTITGLTLGGTDASNYALSQPITVTANITPAPLTITATNQSKTYGSALTLGTTGFTTGTLFNTDSVTGVTLNSSGAAATANVAGSPYSIVPTAAVGSGLGNYNISYNNGSLTVNVAPLTITATNQSKTYGSALTLGTTGFTTSTLFNGDTVTGVTLNHAGAAGTAVVSGSPYSIIPNSAVGTGLGNYNISYVNGSLTVNTAP